MSDWFIYLTKKNATWEDYLYGKQIMLISLFDHVKILYYNGTVGNTGLFTDGWRNNFTYDNTALPFWRNHFIPVLEREPCKEVMRKACRVSDDWREKCVAWVLAWMYMGRSRHI